MGASRDFLTFFGSPPEVRPPTDFDAKWLKRRAFTQGWYFCSKNRNFSYPWSPWPLKGQNFENIRSIWPLTLEVQREREHPLFLYESYMKVAYWIGKVGVRNWNMYLNFTKGYTSRDIADAQWRFSCVSKSAWYLGRNISETVRDRDLGPKDHQ